MAELLVPSEVQPDENDPTVWPDCRMAIDCRRRRRPDPSDHESFDRDIVSSTGDRL